MKKLLNSITLILLTSALFVSGAVAQEVDQETQMASFEAGTHYKVLEIPVTPSQAEQVEVVEVFSYMCVHCFNFDPYVEHWAEEQGGDVNFYRLPAVFNQDWELMAQAFFTAETLGVTDKVHSYIFDELHNKNRDMRQPDNLAQLFEEQAEVAEDDFKTAYNSFSVRSRVQQSKAKARAFKISGVPTMVVAGKYVVDGRMAGGNAAMLQVVDYLVNLEREARQ